MTFVVGVVSLLAAAWAAVCFLGVLWLTVGGVRDRHLQRHIDQALDVTRPRGPVGPEDDPRWPTIARGMLWDDPEARP